MRRMKLPKVYEPEQYESDIYALWEKSRAFVADPHSHKEHFSISMPPPNETGTLSIGHALFLTLQDIMARHARQQGKDVLWLPGSDHAAMADATLPTMRSVLGLQPMEAPVHSEPLPPVNVSTPPRVPHP